MHAIPYVNQNYLGGRRSLFQDWKPDTSDSEEEINEKNTQTYFNVDQYIPQLFKTINRDFTISTNNGQYKFNKDILLLISDTIISENDKTPNLQEYHLSIDDDQNVMKKIELLIAGESVEFLKADKEILRKIIKKLKLDGFPEYIYPKDVRRIYGDEYRKKSFPEILYLRLQPENLHCFVINRPSNFIMKTNKNRYTCNRIYARISDVIRQFIEENPQVNEFQFDFEDKQSEIQPMIDIFNGAKRVLTINQMEALLPIAEQLQVRPLIEYINKSLSELEARVEKADANLDIILPIDELFAQLVNIKQTGAESVAKYIFESSWIQSKPDVQELVACLLQIIYSDLFSHRYLIDLIILLDNQKGQYEHLAELIPFITNRLLTNFGESTHNLSFLYQMSRKKIISIDVILRHLISLIFKYQDSVASNSQEDYINYTNPKWSQQSIILSLSWFYPELLERQPTMIQFINQIKSKNSQQKQTISRPYPPTMRFMTSKEQNDTLGEYFVKLLELPIEDMNYMRDNCIPKDSLIEAIRADDLDSMRNILIENGVQDVTLTFLENNTPAFSQKSPQSFLFQQTGKISLIDYSAFYGSINCFKHLLLNHSTLNHHSLAYAVIGGNLEILRLIIQNRDKIETSDFSKNPDLMDYPGTYQRSNFIFIALLVAICTHQNHIVDWLLEQPNYDIFNDLPFILQKTVSSGNAHALSVLFDHGLNLNQSSNSNNIKEAMNLASSNGFLKIVQFLQTFLDKQLILDQTIRNGNGYYRNFNDQVNSNINNSASFGIVQIFQIYLNNIGPKFSIYYENALKTAIRYNNIDIVKYILIDCKFKVSPSVKNHLLVSSIRQLADDVTNYLLEDTDIQVTSKIIASVCRLGNINLVQKLTQKALDNHISIDFTNSFIESIIHSSEDIINYLFEKKVSLNYKKIFQELPKIIQSNPKSVPLLLKFSNPEVKEELVICALNETIKVQDLVILELLLNQNITYQDLLINAVENSTLPVIEKIIEHNSDPSFINHIGQKGTALRLAVSLQKNDIVSFLLKLKGIVPSLALNPYQSPMYEACMKSNLEAVDLLLPFFKNDISHINLCLKAMIGEGTKLAKLENLSKKKKNKAPKRSWGGTIPFSHEQWQNLQKQQLKYSKKNENLIITRLLELDNVDPNLFILSGNLLSYAVINKYEDVITRLLELNIDINSHATNKCETCLHLAIKDANIFRLLLSHPNIDVNAQNLNEETPLLLAVKYNLDEIVKLILQHPSFNPKLSKIDDAFFLSIPSKSISRILLDNGKLDVNKANKDNITPLMEAFRFNDEDLINRIIQHPSFDLAKSHGISCLFRSAVSQNLKMFRLFLQLAGNQISIKNLKNESLLTAAALVDNNDDILNEIMSHKDFDSGENNIQQAFISAANDHIREILYKYDKEHDHHINPDTFSKKNQEALQFIQQKQGIIPKIQPFCTYLATGTQNSAQQVLYLCTTCGITDPNNGFCYVCARYCHRGHHIYRSKQQYGRGQGYCHCGSYNPNCKCVPLRNQRPQNQGINLNADNKENKVDTKKPNQFIYDILEKKSSNKQKKTPTHTGGRYPSEIIQFDDIDDIDEYSDDNINDEYSDDNIYEHDNFANGQFNFNNIQPNYGRGLGINLNRNPNRFNQNQNNLPALPMNDIDYDYLDTLQCTFDLSHGNSFIQPMYQCQQCNINDDSYICQHCAIRCHQNHNISFVGFMKRSYCSCFNGAECHCTNRKTLLCTYLFYGTQYISQPFNHCPQCGLVGSLGCCSACAKICHKDHEIQPSRSPSCFCDCGDPRNGLHCKCCNFPEFNYLLHCTNRNHKNKPKEARMYHCLTCNMTAENEGICEACAIHCHYGHQIEYAGINNFVCECNSISSSNEMNSNRCNSNFCLEMMDDGKCRRLRDDKDDIIGGAYVCYTCDKEGKKKYCESCIVRCHKGHDVHLIDYSIFECSCELDQCQCMNH